MRLLASILDVDARHSFRLAALADTFDWQMMVVAVAMMQVSTDSDPWTWRLGRNRLGDWP